MKTKKNFLIGLLSLSLVSAAQQGPREPEQVPGSDEFLSQGAVSEIPFVNDLENIFTEEQVHDLEQILRDFEKSTRNQIVLVTVENIDPRSDFDQTALHLIDELQMERKIKGSGIVLVFSKNLRKIHLNTEFETDKKVSDDFYADVVNTTIIPEFKAENHYAGIRKGLGEIIGAWK